MIFCVEDEQNICELEVYTLQSVGMEAQGCGSGRELFALLEKQVPELIVLDIMLPDEDGVSILRRCVLINVIRISRDYGYSQGLGV